MSATSATGWSAWRPCWRGRRATWRASTSLKTLVPFFAPMKNRLFRRLLLVFIINGSALGVAVSVMLFYVEHVLKGNKLQAGIILLVYFGAAALSVPMWLMLSRRYTKTVAWFIAMVMTVLAMSLAVFLGAGDFALFLPIAIVTGLGIGADYGLPPSVLADIINAPEGKDTQGDTGAYFGLWALSTKLATAIGAAGSLPVAALLGFNPSRGQYSSYGADLRLYRPAGGHQDRGGAADLVHPHRSRTRHGARRADGAALD